MSRLAPGCAALLALAHLASPGESIAREPAAPTSPSPASDTRARLSRALEGTVPSELAVAQVLVPELPAGEVSVEWKLPPRAGWVPVMATVRRRGREVGRAWARVELRPPPGPALVARGTPVRVIVRRGAVTVSAYGSLERAARVTERTSARLNELGRVVSGRLMDSTTLIADEAAP